MAFSLLGKAALLGGAAYLLARGLMSYRQRQALQPAPVTPPQRQPATGFPRADEPPVAHGAATPTEF